MKDKNFLLNNLRLLKEKVGDLRLEEEQLELKISGLEALLYCAKKTHDGLKQEEKYQEAFKNIYLDDIIADLKEARTGLEVVTVNKIATEQFINTIELQMEEESVRN